VATIGRDVLLSESARGVLPCEAAAMGLRVASERY
jgi:hypothetical protein